MKYYSTKEMVKVLNVTAQTLKNWDSNGKLVPHHKTDSGYRYYSEEELVEDLVQIVTVFSCKLQGKIANKAKKMIKELISDDSIEEDKVKTK